MTDIIENPTAEQLEAGGKISGTYLGLPFTDWPLTGSPNTAVLYVGGSIFYRIRRVHVSDYDTTVPVPREALDLLRRRYEANNGTDRVNTCAFLGAVAVEVDDA